MLISVCPYLRCSYDTFHLREMLTLYERYVAKYGIWDEASGKKKLYPGLPMHDLFKAVNPAMLPRRLVDYLMHFCYE